MMNKRIRSMIDAIFCEMKMTAENLALRDELMANAIARYEDMIAQGKTEEEAFSAVAVSLEDVGTLLGEMNSEENAPQEKTEPEAKCREPKGEPEEKAEENAAQNEASQTDLGDALNKAFTALGSWGQSIMPQAKKIAKQMDEATGGVLRDIGRAVEKGVKDAQKAAGDVLDKYQQPAKDAAYTPDASAEDLREEAKDLRAQAELKRVTGDKDGARTLEEQAEALDTQADAIEQAQAIEQASKAEEMAAEKEEDPFVIYAPPVQNEQIYGADGEIDEAAFDRTVDQLMQEAERIAPQQEAPMIDASQNEICFPAAGLHRVKIELDADDIVLESADGSEIVVSWTQREEKDIPKVRMDNHTLTIGRGNADVFKAFLSVFSKNGGQIRVLIPRGYAADYELSTTSGDVCLSGLDAENVTVNTTSGSVRIEPDAALRAACVKAETVSGDVTIGAMAHRIEAESVSGSVFVSCDAVSVKGDVVSGKLHIEGAFDEADVDAVSGSAELICTSVPTGKIKIDTISGSAKLCLPGDIRGFDVEFDSISGSLRNEFGPKRYGTCSLPIHMDTISGKMTIERL